MALPLRAGERRTQGDSTEVEVARARELAARLLVGLPDRWAHTVAVAARAEDLTEVVDPDDRELLRAAAWLHDVGYSPNIAVTGFHLLDGARFLDREGLPPRLCALVAHRSGTRFAARFLGPHLQLRTYRDEHSTVTDALAYADQTVGARGEPLPLEVRLADMLRHHGPGSPQAAVHEIRAPYLRAAADWVEQRLRLGRPS